MNRNERIPYSIYFHQTDSINTCKWVSEFNAASDSACFKTLARYQNLSPKKLKVIWLHTLADIKEKFTSQEFPITGIGITTQNRNWKKNKILTKFA